MEERILLEFTYSLLCSLIFAPRFRLYMYLNYLRRCVHLQLSFPSRFSPSRIYKVFTLYRIHFIIILAGLKKFSRLLLIHWHFWAFASFCPFTSFLRSDVDANIPGKWFLTRSLSFWRITHIVVAVLPKNKTKNMELRTETCHVASGCDISVYSTYALYNWNRYPAKRNGSKNDSPRHIHEWKPSIVMSILCLSPNAFKRYKTPRW